MFLPTTLTNVPVGAHYGWPWVYWDAVFDERVDAPMPAFLTEYTRTPEYGLGAHVAALGLVFTEEGARLGPGFGAGAFIARHGSWSRSPAAGYDVVFVPFDARGNPAGKPRPVLASFLVGDGETRGRPTWVEWDATGALLVSDDTAGIIWRVTAPWRHARRADRAHSRPRAGAAAQPGRRPHARPGEPAAKARSDELSCSGMGGQACSRGKGAIRSCLIRAVSSFLEIFTSHRSCQVGGARFHPPARPAGLRIVLLAKFEKRGGCVQANRRLPVRRVPRIAGSAL